jgi:hypothetical protein
MYGQAIQETDNALASPNGSLETGLDPQASSISGSTPDHYSKIEASSYLQNPVRTYLLPELVAESTALPELLEKILQHAHDDRIHADALGLRPLPQFDPRFVADVKQHGIRKAQPGLPSLNDLNFFGIGMGHRKQNDA